MATNRHKHRLLWALDVDSGTPTVFSPWRRRFKGPWLPRVSLAGMKILALKPLDLHESVR